MILDKLRRYDEGGQTPDPMQLLQAYAQLMQMSEEDFAQLIQEFKSMAPEEQQQALQAIAQELQSQQSQQQGIPLRDGEQTPQQQGNPMVAQLGAVVGNAIYDPVFKTYTYELPKAELGDDITLMYARPKEKTIAVTKPKSTIKSPKSSTPIVVQNSEVQDLRNRASKPVEVKVNQNSTPPLSAIDSSQLAEILNNDVSKYRSVEEKNNKGFNYIPTNDTESISIGAGSRGQGSSINVNVPKYAKVPVEKEGLWQLKSDKLTPVYVFNKNGDTILFDKESSVFVKRKSKSGKYEPITLTDMQTAYYLATPFSKKLIEKHYNVQ